MATDEMSDLRDCRAKLTSESDQMLEAVSRASGRDKSELVREIVHAWYLEKFREHQMIGRFFRESKGSAGAPRGDPAAGEDQ